MVKASRRYAKIFMVGGHQADERQSRSPTCSCMCVSLQNLEVTTCLIVVEFRLETSSLETVVEGAFCRTFELSRATSCGRRSTYHASRRQRDEYFLVTDYNTLQWLHRYVVYEERTGCSAAKLEVSALARNRNCCLSATRNPLRTTRFEERNVYEAAKDQWSS
jgi:hypothetical protein